MGTTQISGIEKFLAKSTGASSTPISQENPVRGSFKSFEDVYRTSYSHGLEAIYNIETIDLRTVRRINESPAPKPVQKSIKTKPEPNHIINQQLEFDFGDEYRECMNSFVLDEPLQVLEISKQAEKCLIENGMSVLKHLIKADLSKFVYLKGMGQGHIDEIRQKLNNYLDGRILHHASSVDFYAWVRTLILTNDIKKMHVLLESFKLSDLCVLSAAENVEVRRLTSEKRHEWQQEMTEKLRSQRVQVEESLKKITAVFILPWIRRRQGFATQEEIIERLQRIAVAPQGVQSVISIFAETYFEGRFPLSDFLIRNDHNLYFADRTSLDAFNEVVAKAQTYFYKSHLSYSLAELVMLLTKEFALNWQGFTEGFIEKCLRACKYFSVRKNEKGLCVRLV